MSNDLQIGDEYERLNGIHCCWCASKSNITVISIEKGTSTYKTVKYTCIDCKKSSTINTDNLKLVNRRKIELKQKKCRFIQIMEESE